MRRNALNGGGKNMKWKNLWVEAQGQFKNPQNMAALLTSQDKIRWKAPFGIEYTRRYFIFQKNYQYVKGNSEETSAIYPTHQLLVKSSLERITTHHDVIQQKKSSYKNVSSFVA